MSQQGRTEGQGEATALLSCPLPLVVLVRSLQAGAGIASLWSHTCDLGQGPSAQGCCADGRWGAVGLSSC